MLEENNLAGSIPEGLSRLAHLDRFGIWGNRLAGKLPDALIQRGLAGTLWVTVEEPLLTDVGEITYESASTSVLCARHRIVLGSDRSARWFAERCRNATEGDRETFCEVKEGKTWYGQFARLAWLMQKSGFFEMHPRYERGITHYGLRTTSATRGARRHEVTNYAHPGPFELWVIQNAIEGVVAGVEWDKVTTQPVCP